MDNTTRKPAARPVGGAFRGKLGQLLRASAAMALLTSLAACGTSGTVSSTANASNEWAGKTIKVGVAVLPPFVIKQGESVTGDTPEIAREALKRMGVTNVETVMVDFDGLIPGLQAGRYDMVAGAMAITPTRCKVVSFSRPYVASPTAFAVKTGNPKGIKRYEDFANIDAKLGILGGGTTVETAKALGVPESKIQIYADQLAGLSALGSGRIDAFVSDPVALIYSIKESRIPNVEVTEQFVETVNGRENPGAAGFVFKKGDSALREAFDKELGAIGTDEFVKIGAKFDIPADSYTLAAKYTTEKLCTP